MASMSPSELRELASLRDVRRHGASGSGSRSGGAGGRADVAAVVAGVRADEHKKATAQQVSRLCAQRGSPADVWLNMRRILKKLNDAGAGIKPRSGERWNKRSLCYALADYLEIAGDDLVVAESIPDNVLDDREEWDSRYWDHVSQTVMTNPYMAETEDGETYLFDKNMLRHVQETNKTHDNRPIRRGTIEKAPHVRDLLDTYALERYGIPLPRPDRRRPRNTSAAEHAY